MKVTFTQLGKMTVGLNLKTMNILVDMKECRQVWQLG